MSQREELKYRIQQRVHKDGDGMTPYSDYSIHISELVMHVLDEFVEETGTSELKVGDRVRRLKHNPGDDEEHGPPLNSVGEVVGWEDSTRWPLVQFNDEFPGGHNGMGSCVDEAGDEVVPDAPCWYCEPTTLEKLP